MVFVAEQAETRAASSGLHKEVAAQLAELARTCCPGRGVRSAFANTEWLSRSAPRRARRHENGTAPGSRAPRDELVVLKGSRGTALERILPAILPAPRPTEARCSIICSAPLGKTPFFNLFNYISFRAAGAMVTALLIAFVVGPGIIRRCTNSRWGR